MPGMIKDWPMVHEYDKALLNRSNTFRDPDIQYGELKELHPGMPMHLNGGGSQHVCVYKVGNWVVRCFVSDPPQNVEPPADIIPRYEKITTYIKQRQRNDDLQFLVTCDLVASGVNIGGKSFPYLKIPYVPNSRSLGDFLSDHYRERQTIALIAQRWLDMTRQMESLHIAHGDLDLSNVLIYGGYPSLNLYLIDFDGMYIPEFALTNMGVTDHGHTHFQPAQSSIRKFDSTMDRFSSLVIYLSLCALEQNPDLWDRCEASDRNMLLHDEDFQRLAQSTRFPLLRQERQNKPLQLCLNELQESIDRRKMPRSLTEILKEIESDGDDYVYRSTTTEPNIALPLVFPVEDEPVTANNSSTDSSTQYTSPSSDNQASGAKPSSTKGCIITLVIIVIIVIIIVLISQSHQTPQQQSSSIIVQGLQMISFGGALWEWIG